MIEIQVAYQFDSIKRLWFYQCNQVTKNADEHKKESVETHRLSEEMLPVYTIAIMQKRYFNDEEMVHVYCLKERKRKKDAISQAWKEGKAEDIEHGKKMMIISFIKDDLLSKEEGAKR